MKRSPLRRKTPLRAKQKPLKRTRLKPRGKGSRYPKSVDREYRAWIRTFACAVMRPDGADPCGFWTSRPKVEPAHVKPWGSSGQDRGNIAPLCPKHHDEQESNTAAFEQRHGMNLARIARALQREYEAR